MTTTDGAPVTTTQTGAGQYARADQYGYADLLTDDERAVLARLRTFLETQAAPLVADHWERGEFPTELLAPLAGLDLMAPPALTAGGARPRQLFEGFRAFELARTDASLATYFNGQASLFRSNVLLGGSAEQVARWDPLITRFEMTGVFALTEPGHGSDIAGGLATTARRDGDTWIIDGAKRWIGSAAYSDYLTVVARDAADGKAKAFLVRTDAPGVQLRKIGGKVALRMVNNADITLTGVRVSEEHRLQRVDSFADIAAMLRAMRAGVAWIATGVQAGAYEAALRYVLERHQFGRPVGGFQLVQDKLVRMLGNLTASLGMVVRLAQQQDAGIFRDEDSALAKAWVSARMRETVALAREVAGGDGITLATDVARFFADAEAVYTYEGTNEINTLVVGRAITGLSAFTR
ncbi:acyl-CoA dehydrogenase family protein [Georgenia yuyongxinii]